MMKYFFAFWTDIPAGMAFPSFGIAHIAALMLSGLTIYLLLWKMKHLSQLKNERIVKIISLILPVLEVTRVAWLIYTGEHRFIKLLPLHLCSMQVYFVPIAVFTNIKGFKELVYCTGILGGISGIVFPVGVSNTYPLIHYQTIETLIFHSVLIFVPLALVLRLGFRPQLRYFPRMLFVFALTAAAAAVADFGFGQNYMFLAEPPVGTPFEWIFNTFGHWAYWISFFIFGCTVSLCMMVPFNRHMQD